MQGESCRVKRQLPRQHPKELASCCSQRLDHTAFPPNLLHLLDDLLSISFNHSQLSGCELTAYFWV